jgi:NAD(P)-dependent dehydrogenase (short-subunit alcohol dehydrogenase family)
MKIDSSTAAVVTGAASGLGKATAEALAATGVKVAVFDVNEEQGETVAKSIGGVFCKVDITNEESVVAGFRQGPRRARAGTHHRALRNDLSPRQDAGI